jgi:hypothetical protein
MSVEVETVDLQATDYVEDTAFTLFFDAGFA